MKKRAEELLEVSIFLLKEFRDIIKISVAEQTSRVFDGEDRPFIIRAERKRDSGKYPIMNYHYEISESDFDLDRVMRPVDMASKIASAWRAMDEVIEEDNLELTTGRGISQ